MTDEEMMKEALDNTTGYKNFHVDIKKGGIWVSAKEYTKISTLKQEIARLDEARAKTKSNLEYRVIVY